MTKRCARTYWRTNRLLYLHFKFDLNHNAFYPKQTLIKIAPGLGLKGNCDWNGDGIDVLDLIDGVSGIVTGSTVTEDVASILKSLEPRRGGRNRKRWKRNAKIQQMLGVEQGLVIPITSASVIRLETYWRREREILTSWWMANRLGQSRRLLRILFCFPKACLGIQSISWRLSSMVKNHRPMRVNKQYDKQYDKRKSSFPTCPLQTV